jgi:hypothetical protein
LRLGGERRGEEHRAAARENVRRSINGSSGLLGDRRDAYRRALVGGTIPFIRR